MRFSRRRRAEALVTIRDTALGDANSSSEENCNLGSRRSQTRTWAFQSLAAAQMLGMYFLSLCELLFGRKSHQATPASVLAVGVRASERLAEIDMPYLLRYQPVMRTVGQKYCMDPAVIAGVVSREHPGGNLLVHGGNVDDGIRVVQVTLQVAAMLRGTAPERHLGICCADGTPGAQLAGSLSA